MAERVDSLYVWVRTDGAPVIAGRFEQRGEAGVFYYANSYIARPDAFALDPVNLPLVPQREFHTAANGGVWGVLLDAGPDSWGQRVLAQLSPSRPRNSLEFLLAGNGDGCGCLLFSLSQGSVKLPRLRGEGTDLALLEKAASDLLKGEEIAPDLRAALLAGSSVGGARPKASLVVDGWPHIAKFGRDTDVYDEVRAERASLALARAAGFEVPESRLVQTPGGSGVLLVRRFDYDPAGRKRHYISAHALLNLPRAQEHNPAHGYPGLAALLRRFAAGPREASRELFRRMAFRVLIGDTDDHGRNHGFLLVDGQWRHAPLFDVQPHLAPLDAQAMPIGQDGRARTLDNLLSMTEAFGLEREEAAAIVADLRSVLARWREFFAEAGVGERDIELLSPCFGLLEDAGFF